MDYNEIYTSAGNVIKGADLKGCDPVTLTIKSWETKSFTEKDGTVKHHIYLGFEETDKMLRLNRTNANSIEYVTGSPDTDNWVGKKITIHHAVVEVNNENKDAVRVLMPAKETGKKAGFVSAAKQEAKQVKPESENPAPDDEIPF